MATHTYDVNLKRKIKSISEMAERGTPNEKRIAAQKLKELLKKHNLTLDDFAEEKTNVYFFPCQTIYERKLLFQIAYKVTNEAKTSFYKKSSGKQIGLELRKAEKIEIDRLFTAYKKQLEKEFSQMFSAFVQKHQLFGEPPEDGSKCELTLDEIAKLVQMMKGMDDLKVYKELPLFNP